MELLDRHVFTHIGSASRPSRNITSWTSDGVRYTLDTTTTTAASSSSYSSPVFSFEPMMGTANGPFRHSTVGARPSSVLASPGSLLGSALSMLDDLWSMQQQQQQPRQNVFQPNHGPTSTGHRRIVIETVSDTDDETVLEQADSLGPSRRQSMLSRLKDKLLDGKEKSRPAYEYSQSRSRDASRNRDPSPPLNRSRAGQRASLSPPELRSELREAERTKAPRTVHNDFIQVDYDDHYDDDGNVVFGDASVRTRKDRNRKSQPADISTVDLLVDTVDIEHRAVRVYKLRLEDAVKQPGTSSDHLQRLVDKLRRHEVALKQAQANLDRASAAKRGARVHKQSSQRMRSGGQARPQVHQPPQRMRSGGQAEPQVNQPPVRNVQHDCFPHPFAGMNSPFRDPREGRHSHPHSHSHPHPHPHPHPAFQAFENMDPFGHPFTRTGFDLHDQIFEQMQQQMNSAQFHFHASAKNPGHYPSQENKDTRPSAQNAGFRFQQQQQQPSPGFTAFAQPSPKQPPARLLQPHEAKSLFKLYNDRWNTIPSTDYDIPYPARGLQARALMARDSIWAPLCHSDVATWSDETVMQANAQAFFLGVVGLQPVYTEAPGSGRISMSFDESRASPAQIQELVAMLKKEKTRWHSDRLGRRNGGCNANGGPNETLQKDERARAVFHAVCGLMESAQ